MQELKKIIQESIETKTKLLQDVEQLETIQQVIETIANAFLQDKKILLCGNGGSAADAQHIAAELTGRFYKNRKALYADALHCNSSYITAVANDYNFETIYARLIEGIGKPHDILIAISTSGNSKNIIEAVLQAKKNKLITIGMTGKTGGTLKQYCDYCITVPSENTPRIQEAHILIGHIICELVEEKLFPTSI